MGNCVRPRFSRLLGVADFPLVADGEDADPVLPGEVSIECDVARATERNHQLPEISLDTATDKRVLAQCFDSIPDRFHCVRGDARIVLGEKFERPLDIAER